MTNKELQLLIDYHKTGLEQYRMQMTLSAQYLEEQTVKILEELLKDRKDEN